MKSSVETLSATRVRLAVEVPFAELEPSLRKVYRELGSQVTIPGFRKGKVPNTIIDQRFGRDRMIAEAVQDVIPVQLVAAIREHDVHSMGRPEIEVTEISDGQHVRFTAEVDVRPEITLPDLDTIEVTVESVEVSDADVEQELEALRQRFASLRPVERAAQRGDFVQIDLSATIDGEEVAGGSATNLSYEIGSGQLLDGLDDALAGMAAGGEANFTTKLVGGEHAGRDADVSVTLRSVKERDLPAADDEFAQQASQFDTLDELRTDLGDRLRQFKQIEQLYTAREKTIEALAAACPVPIPHQVAQDEVDSRREAMLEELNRMGVTLSAYLESVEKTEAEFEAQLAAAAADAIKSHLLIEAYADDNKITLTDEEFGQEIVHRARRAGMEPKDYYEKLNSSGMGGAVYSEARRDKALSTLVRHVRVVDSTGTPVNFDKLVGAADPDATDDDATDDQEQPAS